MRRSPLGAAGVITLALTLAACGDSGDTNDGNGSGPKPDCSPSTTELAVGALDKLKFDAASYSTDAGCVEITYTNEGSIAHTLLLKSVKGFKLSIGDVDTGTLELEPGAYTIYCDVAGHEAAGMKAELTVS